MKAWDQIQIYPSNSTHATRRARSAQTPAAPRSDPLATLKRRRARGEDRTLRAEAANMAYSVALNVAKTTKVVARIHNCGPTLALGFKNWGRNATKNTIPFGLSAVTR